MQIVTLLQNMTEIPERHAQMGQAVKRLCSEGQTADGAQVSLEVGSGTWEVSSISAS